MSTTVLEMLKQAKSMWPDAVDAEFVKDFVAERLLSKEEAAEILS